MTGVGITIGSHADLKTAVDEGAALFLQRTGEVANLIALPIGFKGSVMGYEVSGKNSQPGIVLVGREMIDENSLH